MFDTKPTPAMRERHIEAYLVKRVKELGGEVRKVVWQGRRGAPDRLVMVPTYSRTGRYSTVPGFWVELKAPGVPAETYQLREHARMRGMGQVVVVVDSLLGVDELLA